MTSPAGPASALAEPSAGGAAAAGCAPRKRGPNSEPATAAPTTRTPLMTITITREPLFLAATGFACSSLIGGLRTGSRLRRRSTLDVDQLLQHLVGGGDRLRVRRERALVLDQADELLGQIDVGLFERARRDGSAAAAARGAERGRAALPGLDPEALTGA